MLIMAFSFLRMFLTMTANSRGWWQTACKSKHTSEAAEQMLRTKWKPVREDPLRTIFLPICISFILSTTLEFCWAIDCSVLMAWSNKIRAWDSCSTFSNVKSSLWATHTHPQTVITVTATTRIYVRLIPSLTLDPFCQEVSGFDGKSSRGVKVVDGLIWQKWQHMRHVHPLGHDRVKLHENITDIQKSIFEFFLNPLCKVLQFYSTFRFRCFCAQLQSLLMEEPFRPWRSHTFGSNIQS